MCLRASYIQALHFLNNFRSLVIDPLCWFSMFALSATARGVVECGGKFALDLRLIPLDWNTRGKCLMEVPGRWWACVFEVGISN